MRNAYREFLLTALALQDRLIDESQLVDLARTAFERQDGRLTELLSERGWLTEAQRTELETRLTEASTERPVAETTDSLPDPGTTVLPDEASSDASLDTLDWSSSSLEQASSSSGATRGPDFPESRYERLRLLATGGMGEIWLVRDHHLGRDVAMKGMRPERIRSRALVQRFLDEARINARLEHPHLVPVHDLLEDPRDQTLQCTMRFIEGQTLSEAVQDYHRKRGQDNTGSLRLRTLLDALVAVCNAVGFAHERHVLHRDLKGANIVLGSHGEVVLLDWGVAKDLKRDGRAPISPFDSSTSHANHGETDPGAIVGTLSHMAPEQARGEDIDQRADIYGLGAILYTILTGRPPHSAGDRAEQLRRVLHEAPERPRSLVSAVPRPLEAICLKALARDRAERYNTAEAMAEDLRRWLADEPVSAYPDPWTQRLRRWSRRNRPAVAAAAALVVTGVIALGVNNWLVRQEQQRTEVARNVALGNLNLARQAVNTILLGVAQTNLPNTPGTENLRRTVAERASYFYRQFLRNGAEDPQVLVEGADASRQIGTILRQSNLFHEAIQSYDQAIQILESLIAANPGNAYYQDMLAQILIESAVVRGQQGRILEQEPPLRRAIAIAEALKDVPPTRGVNPPRTLARALATLSGFLQKTGSPQEALEAGRQAVALMATVPEPASFDPLLHFDRIFASRSLAPALTELGDLEAAEEAARNHAAFTRAFLEREPGNNDRRMLHARSLNDLARVLDRMPGRQGQAEAEATYGESLALAESLVEDFPDLPMYRALLAETLVRRGGLLAELGRPENASNDLERAESLVTSLLDATPGLPEYRSLRGQALAWRGRLTLNAGDTDAARKTLDEAHTLIRQALDANAKSPRDREFLEQIEADQDRLPAWGADAGERGEAQP